MKNILLSLLFVSASVGAATLYLDDGTQIDLGVGSKVYIDDGTVWSFTRFDEGGFDLRPLTPVVEVTESCVGGGFTFGGGSEVCTEEVVVEEEPEEGCLTFGGEC